MYRSPAAHRAISPPVYATAALLALVAANVPSHAADASDADYSEYDHHDGKFTVCKRGCRYDKIQRAVDKAKAGATILIGPGTYFENVVIDEKSVTLVGVSADETTIDGSFRGPVFALGSQNLGTAPASISVTLTGLTITHGQGVTGGGISQNVTMFEVTDSVIVSNVATQSGGGIDAQSASDFIPPDVPATTIERCVIVNNQAPIGAGIEIEAEAAVQITDSIVSGNVGGDGAGLHGEYASSTHVDGTTLSNNMSSGDGGGIWIASPKHVVGVPGGSVNLSSSAVVNNTAAGVCGGVAVAGNLSTTCAVGSPGVVIALNVPGP
jgi:hypothetical protein